MTEDLWLELLIQVLLYKDGIGTTISQKLGIYWLLVRKGITLTNPLSLMGLGMREGLSRLGQF